MKVTVDRELCQGHARCVLKAPEVFELDDLGHAVSPGEVSDEFESQVRSAVVNCPERAISVD